MSEASRDVALGRPPAQNAVHAYKGILRAVLDNRPSGTRQRLAVALGKNRSFVSQIANPAYPVPIPAQHLPAIFDVCHFSPTERGAFIDAYRRAHPGRLESVGPLARMRVAHVAVPDLHDTRKNALVDDLIQDVARRVARLIDDLSSETNEAPT